MAGPLMIFSDKHVFEDIKFVKSKKTVNIFQFFSVLTVKTLKSPVCYDDRISVLLIRFSKRVFQYVYPMEV